MTAAATARAATAKPAAAAGFPVKFVCLRRKIEMENVFVLEEIRKDLSFFSFAATFKFDESPPPKPPDKSRYSQPYFLASSNNISKRCSRKIDVNA